MKHQTAYQKATAKIEKEGQKQCFLAYGAAAEKAAAVQWELSNREKAIIRGLIV